MHQPQQHHHYRFILSYIFATLSLPSSPFLGHWHTLIQTLICNAKNEKHLHWKLIFIHPNIVFLFVDVHTVQKLFVCTFCNLVCLCIDIHWHHIMSEHGPDRQHILRHIVWCLFVVFIYSSLYAAGSVWTWPWQHDRCRVAHITASGSRWQQHLGDAMNHCFDRHCILIPGIDTNDIQHIRMFKIYIVHHHIPHALRTWYL